MIRPQATAHHTTLRFNIPDHLVYAHALRRGISVGPLDTLGNHTHVNLLYGLPGDTYLQTDQRERIAAHLAEARVLAVDVTSPVLFATPTLHTLAFLVTAPRLLELREALLAEFPEAEDPYRHGDWIPHVTFAMVPPGKSWQMLGASGSRTWGPVSLPVSAFEVHRADGPIEVLTPLGALTAYR